MNKYLTIIIGILSLAIVAEVVFLFSKTSYFAKTSQDSTDIQFVQEDTLSENTQSVYSDKQSLVEVASTQEQLISEGVMTQSRILNTYEMEIIDIRYPEETGDFLYLVTEKSNQQFAIDFNSHDRSVMEVYDLSDGERVPIEFEDLSPGDFVTIEYDIDLLEKAGKRVKGLSIVRSQ